MKTRRKRQYTEADKAAREAKRARMRELGARVSALTPEQRSALADRAGIRNIEGRPVSTHNACFLMHQLENVSVIGGFNQWKTAGRIVCSGKNSGLCIWAPTGSKDPDNGEINERTGFILVTVFDISQTRPLDAQADAAPIDTAEAAQLASAEVIQHLNAARPPSNCSYEDYECGDAAYEDRCAEACGL